VGQNPDVFVLLRANQYERATTIPFINAIQTTLVRQDLRMDNEKHYVFAHCLLQLVFKV